MAQQYEIEVKSLLGSPDKALQLVQKMSALDPSCVRISQSNQLNHYFIGGSLKVLVEALQDLFSPGAYARLAEIAANAQEYSVRTRQKETEVLFIVKASVDDTSSANGISRIEFEESVPLSLIDLDNRILDAGFRYEAKWSRAREEYSFKGVNVCLDKNAGYGYLAEFEKIVDDPDTIPAAREELRVLMEQLGAEELSQERLGRMFAFYNQNWNDYYGTEKIFVIE